jgi:hypothetical protein
LHFGRVFDVSCKFHTFWFESMKKATFGRDQMSPNVKSSKRIIYNSVIPKVEQSSFCDNRHSRLFTVHLSGEKVFGANAFDAFGGYVFQRKGWFPFGPMGRDWGPGCTRGAV